MTKPMAAKSTLLVMAGGTGGHIFPGIAVADELKAQGWDIYWLGTADRMEARIVPEHGYEISFIDISGLRGKGLLTMLAIPFKIMRSLWQARQVLKAVKPDVVLGMGGYASGPGGLMAWLSGVPLIIHEQNAAAGLSNRLLAKIAKKVCCAFPNAFTADIKVDVVGNPLRAVIGQAANTASQEDNTKSGQNILVVGGSLGARVLNQVMPESYKKLVEQGIQVNIWHQTGSGNESDVNSHYQSEDIDTGKVKVTEFIDDMASAYQWADLVICRAGALTVSELAVAATPAIFVPLPHAVDDHQTKNAMYLVENQAAKLLPQSEFNADSVSQMITDLCKAPETLQLMAKAAKSAGNRDASTRVAQLCQQLAETN